MLCVYVAGSSVEKSTSDANSRIGEPMESNAPTPTTFSRNISELKNIADQLDKGGKLKEKYPALVEGIRSVAICIGREEEIIVRGVKVDSSIEGAMVQSRRTILHILRRLEASILSNSISALYEDPSPLYADEAKLLESASTILSGFRSGYRGFVPSSFANSAVACISSSISNITEIFASVSSATSLADQNRMQMRAENARNALLRDMKSYLYGMERGLNPSYNLGVMPAPEPVHRGPRSTFKDRIAASLRQGEPPALIAEKFGCSVHTVYRWTTKLRKEGLVIEPMSQQIKPDVKVSSMPETHEQEETVAPVPIPETQIKEKTISKIPVTNPQIESESKDAPIDKIQPTRKIDTKTQFTVPNSDGKVTAFQGTNPAINARTLKLLEKVSQDKVTKVIASEMNTHLRTTALWLTNLEQEGLIERVPSAEMATKLRQEGASESRINAVLRESRNTKFMRLTEAGARRLGIPYQRPLIPQISKIVNVTVTKTDMKILAGIAQEKSTNIIGKENDLDKRAISMHIRKLERLGLIRKEPLSEYGSRLRDKGFKDVDIFRKVRALGRWGFHYTVAEGQESKQPKQESKPTKVNPENKRTSKATDEEWREEYKSDRTVKEIASRRSVPVFTVYNNWARMKLKPKEREIKKHPQTAEEPTHDAIVEIEAEYETPKLGKTATRVLELLNQKRGAEDIAHILGKTSQAVYYHASRLRKAGLLEDESEESTNEPRKGGRPRLDISEAALRKSFGKMSARQAGAVLGVSNHFVCVHWKEMGLDPKKSLQILRAEQKLGREIDMKKAEIELLSERAREIRSKLKTRHAELSVLVRRRK